MQPIYDFGGDGPLIHLAVANGFPPQTYTPLLEPLTQNRRIVSLVPRALWPDEKPPDKLISWQDGVAKDLSRGLHDYGFNDIIAIGHSIGGIATILTAAKEPERFKAIILLDPTILPSRLMWTFQIARFLGYKHNPLSRKAEKRRYQFESVDAAFSYFRGKRLFKDLTDESLRYYAESIVPSGEGFELAWPREWERFYFRTFYTKSWYALPKLRGKMPILTIRGMASDTLFPGAAARMRRILPDMDYAEVAGHGHLFPQSAPDETRQIIVDWLAGLR